MSNVQCLDYRDEEIYEAVYLEGRPLGEVALRHDLSLRTVRNVALATMKELARRQFDLAQMTPLETLLFEKARLEAQWRDVMQGWRGALEGEGTWAQKASGTRFLMEARRIMRDQRSVDALLARQAQTPVAESRLEPAESLDGTPVEGREAIAVVGLMPSVQPTPTSEMGIEPSALVTPPQERVQETVQETVQELVPQVREQPAPASLDSELLRILAEPSSPLAAARPTPPKKSGPISRRAAALLQREKQATASVAPTI